MNRLALSFCLALSALVATAVHAEEAPPRFDAFVLLDQQLSDEQRAAQLPLLKAAADGGEHAARCLLGRVGYQRTMTPSRWPQGEYGDAAGYLNSCVIGGDIDGMLVLAEVELRAGRPLEAMIWVQAHLKLALMFGEDFVNFAAPYKAGLIARIERAYASDRPDNEEILEYAAGLLAQHGQRIVDNCQKGGCEWMRALLPQSAGKLEATNSASTMAGRFSRDYSSARDQLTFASFLLAIDESGRPAKVVALEGYPTPEAARDLASHARSRRYNEVAEGTGLRYLSMPVFLDNKAYDLMPDADVDRRPHP